MMSLGACTASVSLTTSAFNQRSTLTKCFFTITSVLFCTVLFSILCNAEARRFLDCNCYQRGPFSCRI